MLTEDDLRNATAKTLYDSQGDKIGHIAQIYLDDTTGNPEFLTVTTGFFGNNESFVPAQDASEYEDGLAVPFSKQQVKDAPNVAADGHLEPAGEQELYDYYGLSSAAPAADASTPAPTADAQPTAPATQAPGDTQGDDVSGPNTDTAMTRSEEHLNVSTRTQQAGKARLRKYVTTEEQTVTVPVTREYAVLETEPITDENIGDATIGGEITSEEHEVLLNEEVVDVTKTVKPVERVRLGTETRTEEQTVTDEVRKEHIEVDGDVEDHRS